MNKVKPTEKQRQTFQHIKHAKDLQTAMLAGGYSVQTSKNPKQKLVDSRGFQILLQEYREDLKKAGVSSELLAEIQAEGLFDQDPRVRLDYVKETKKDLGIGNNEAGIQQNTQVNVFTTWKDKYKVDK
jgi:hypothetical protein